jgi:hypothetical protein
MYMYDVLPRYKHMHIHHTCVLVTCCQCIQTLQTSTSPCHQALDIGLGLGYVDFGLFHEIGLRMMLRRRSALSDVRDRSLYDFTGYMCTSAVLVIVWRRNPSRLVLPLKVAPVLFKTRQHARTNPCRWLQNLIIASNNERTTLQDSSQLKGC